MESLEFTNASDLKKTIDPTQEAYIANLEARIRDQDRIIDEQSNTIQELEQSLLKRSPISRERPELNPLTMTERLALMVRINDLTIAQNETEIEQDQKLINLTKTVSILEKAIENLSRDIAQDRQRITKFEEEDPQPLQKDRGDILHALLAANGGKMPLKTARQKMRMSKQAFTNLLFTLKEDIAAEPMKTNKRQKLLVLK